MNRRAFTMIELLIAILILGVVTSLSVLTFNAITSAWTVSTEYLDKTQRSDYALEQIVSGLKSMYAPADGKTDDYTYGFYLYDNGDGKDARNSDVIEWAKTGSGIVGNQNATVDSVHRVQLMVLEEGNRDFKDAIEVTGLYARLCPDPALRPKHQKEVSEVDYSFANSDMYQPILITDGIVGFNCRVQAEPGADDGKNDRMKFEDEWASSNQVPYKVELTFWLADPDGKSYRSNTAPVMRIVRLPVYEQSKDRKTLPTEDEKGAAGAKGRQMAGGNGRPAAGVAGNAAPGGPGAAPGAAPGGPGMGGPR